MTDESQRQEEADAEDRLAIVVVWIVILALTLAAFGLIIPQTLIQ